MSVIRTGMIVVASGAVVLMAAAAITYGLLSREVVTPVTTLNPSGTKGKALMVFAPGLSRFPDDVTQAFADGLAAAGWRVDRTTASRQAPNRPGEYDLIVLGSPVYANAAAPALTAYIERLDRLDGKPVALVFTAAGDTAPAMDASATAIANHGGRVVGRFGYTTQHPNESLQPLNGTNQERALTLARQAGQSLRPAAS